MSWILGKKLEMTRVIHEGKYVPITLIKVPKLTLVQIKTLEHDGYDALVLEMEDGSQKCLREVPFSNFMACLAKWDTVSLDVLDDIKEVETLSISKGKSFQWAMKRWNFHGLGASHGHKYVRSLGSIGTRKPRRTKPWKKMHWHMGLDSITRKHVPLILVNKDLSVIGLKGPVAGARNSLIEITF